MRSDSNRGSKGKEAMNVIQKSDERGAALIIALLVMLVLIVVSAGLVTTSVVNTKISGVDQRRAKALDLAEAGVSEAISRIKSGEVPSDLNPRMVAQIFNTNSGSVPTLGTDSVALATAQPAGNWLTYTTANKSADLLTVKFKTDGSGNTIYKYDPQKSLPIQTDTGMPIYQIRSTGNVGGTKRTVVAEAVVRPLPLNIHGALASKVDVKFTGNAVSCGYDHRSDTPAGTGTNGRAGFGGCNENPANEWWEIPGDEMAGLWSGNNVSVSGGAGADGIPVSSQSQPGFYAGPWEALGMTQAQFWAWAGAPQANMPANTNQNIYLDNDGTTQNASGNWTLNCTGSGLLYVDGDLTLNAGFTWRGLVYVEGELSKLNGNAWILGAVIAKGRTETKFNGGATVLWSRDAVLQNVGRGGAMSVISWREVR
jgi:Tfp pilus assembly protein PilX